MAKKKKNGKPTIVSTGFVPHRHQYNYMVAWKRFNLCVCTRGWGKTVMAANMLNDSASKETTPKSYAYIAPVKGQAKDSAWPFFTEYLKPLEEAGILKFRDSDMTITYLKSGTTIQLYGTDDGNDKRIRGLTLAGLVCDEFDEISSTSWSEIILPTMRNNDSCWALLIGTVKPGGHMSLYREEFKSDPEWNIATYKLSECWEDLPAYNEQDIKRLARIYANRPNEYAREFECDDLATSADCIIPAKLVKDARGRFLAKDAYALGVKVLGVDVSTGTGADDSCLFRRQGLASFEPHTCKLDNMGLADLVARTIDNWKPDATFIDAGRGEGVISRLRQLGYAPIPVDFGSRPINGTRFVNKRIEMYYGIKDWLEEGGSLPDSDRLCRELMVPTFVESENDRFKMEKKEDIKKKLGRSPDIADALALTFAAPVARLGDHGNNCGIRSITTANGGYSPLANR